MCSGTCRCVWTPASHSTKALMSKEDRRSTCAKRRTLNSTPPDRLMREPAQVRLPARPEDSTAHPGHALSGREIPGRVEPEKKATPPISTKGPGGAAIQGGESQADARGTRPSLDDQLELRSALLSRYRATKIAAKTFINGE